MFSSKAILFLNFVILSMSFPELTLLCCSVVSLEHHCSVEVMFFRLAPPFIPSLVKGSRFRFHVRFKWNSTLWGPSKSEQREAALKCLGPPPEFAYLSFFSQQLDVSTRKPFWNIVVGIWELKQADLDMNTFIVHHVPLMAWLSNDL